MRRYCLLFFAVLLAVFLVSCDTGYTYCEISLPLGAEYEDIDYEGFDASFSNGEAVACILRISFEAGFKQGIPETMNSRQFANFWRNRVGRNEEIYLDRATPYYTYNQEGYFYVNGFYRSQYAYFVVLFACPEESSDVYLKDFLDILDGAVFKG